MATYDDRLEKQTNPIPSPDSHNIYANIRLRCITRHFVHAKRLDREPSRILMKKLVHLKGNGNKIFSSLLQNFYICLIW